MKLLCVNYHKAFTIDFIAEWKTFNETEISNKDALLTSTIHLFLVLISVEYHVYLFIEPK